MTIRQPSQKLREEINSTILAAKTKGIILDVGSEAMRLQEENGSENIALEDLIKLLIEEACRCQVPIEISDSSLQTSADPMIAA